MVKVLLLHYLEYYFGVDSATEITFIHLATISHRSNLIAGPYLIKCVYLLDPFPVILNLSLYWLRQRKKKSIYGTSDSVKT